MLMDFNLSTILFMKTLVFQSYLPRFAVWMVCFWGPAIPPHKLFGSLRVKGFSGLCILIFYLFLVDWLLSSFFFRKESSLCKDSEINFDWFAEIDFFWEKQKSAKHRGHMKPFFDSETQLSCPEKRGQADASRGRRGSLCNNVFFSEEEGKEQGPHILHLDVGRISMLE